MTNFEDVTLKSKPEMSQNVLYCKSTETQNLTCVKLLSNALGPVQGLITHLCYRSLYKSQKSRLDQLLSQVTAVAIVHI